MLGKRDRNGDEEPDHEMAETVPPVTKEEDEEDSDDDVGPMPMPAEAAASGGAKKKRKGVCDD